MYRIYSRISRQFLAQFRRSSCKVGLYAGHATQPESTVSMTAICQRRSLCVCRTQCEPLVGHVYAWGRARRQGSTDLCCCCCCNLTPFQYSDGARPSFSDDEIKYDDDSTHQISPILTHITDYKGGHVYDDCIELLN